MESVFQDVVREITAEGGTVLLSSHILAEAEALCDTVSIIRSGRIVETGTPHRTAAPDPHHPELHHQRSPSTASTPSRGSTTWSSPTTATRLASRWRPTSSAPSSSTSAQHGVVTLTSTPPTLEELFLRHYGDELATLAANGNGNHGESPRPNRKNAGAPR